MDCFALASSPTILFFEFDLREMLLSSRKTSSASSSKTLGGVIRDVQELKTSLEVTQDKFEEMGMG